MDKEPFEVFLTQEQAKYINEHLPRGYSLQFSTQHARRIQLEPNVSKPLSKLVEKEEIKKANTEQKHSQLLQHALSLDNVQKIAEPVSEDMTVCHYILQQLKKNDNSGPFLQRVDPEAQQCLDYYKVIKNPMDLAKVEHNLKQGLYQTRKQFCDDTSLIWRNSFIYNKQGSAIYKMTEDMSSLFQSLSSQYLATPTTTTAHLEQFSQDSTEIRKRIFTTITANNNNNAAKTARSIRNDMPLSQEAKNWIYKHVGRLPPDDTSSLCRLVKDYCKVNNDSMELNIDTLPNRAAIEVFDFIVSKLPHSSPPNPYPSESSQEDPRKKIKTANQFNDTPLTVLEKKQLSFCIRQLPPEDLCGIWSIITEGKQDSEVIEFDIDTLPVLKARTLQSYVKERVQLQAKKQRFQKELSEQMQQQYKQLVQEQQQQQTQGMSSSSHESRLSAASPKGQPSYSCNSHNSATPMQQFSGIPQQAQQNPSTNGRLTSSTPSQTISQGNTANNYYSQGSALSHQSPGSSSFNSTQ